jgi:hypothetical protein
MMVPGQSRIRALIRAIDENDEQAVEEAVLRLSHSHRALAPLGLAVGAFAMLFSALKLLVSNWRLTLVQMLPAMWIWLAMFDIKYHVLHGHAFNVVRGPVLIPINLVIVAITIAAFYLNAVFAFTIADPDSGSDVAIRPAFQKARHHMRDIVRPGTLTGLALGFSTTIVTRWGRPWFTIALGITIGIMMVAYVAVPASFIGEKPKQSRRDKVSTTVVTGVLSTVVTAPPYLLGRVGLLMLGSKVLLIPGILLLAFSVTVQAGATGAVRAIKMSAALTAGHRPSDASIRLEESQQNSP